jgi:hypothetical protein
MGSSVQVVEKRREERFVYEPADRAFVELQVRQGPDEPRVFDLKVNDCSRTGLGMLVTQNEYDLLSLLKKGDVLQDMSFFATWSVFKVDGRVQHTTRIEEGENKDCYILGVESQEAISNCRPECF